MGLLDQVISGIAGQGGGSGIQNLITSMAGGRSGGSPLAGGLSGLVSQFEQAGLGQIVQSWIGTGPNQPVSPDQLRHALGPDKVEQMASQTGIDQNDLLAQLSEHLPKAVDAATPEGRLPEGTISV